MLTLKLGRGSCLHAGLGSPDPHNGACLCCDSVQSSWIKFCLFCVLSKQKELSQIFGASYNGPKSSTIGCVNFQKPCGCEGLWTDLGGETQKLPEKPKSQKVGFCQFGAKSRKAEKSRKVPKNTKSRKVAKNPKSRKVEKSRKVPKSAEKHEKSKSGEKPEKSKSRNIPKSSEKCQKS